MPHPRPLPVGTAKNASRHCDPWRSELPPVESPQLQDGPWGGTNPQELQAIRHSGLWQPEWSPSRDTESTQERHAGKVTASQWIRARGRHHLLRTRERVTFLPFRCVSRRVIWCGWRARFPFRAGPGLTPECDLSYIASPTAVYSNPPALVPNTQRLLHWGPFSSLQERCDLESGLRKRVVAWRLQDQSFWVLFCRITESRCVSCIFLILDLFSFCPSSYPLFIHWTSAKGRASQQHPGSRGCSPRSMPVEGVW